MILTIIPDDRTVSIDGQRFPIDCTDLAAQNIHAVQWGWTGENGHIEFKSLADGSKPDNELFDDIERFRPFIDAWNAAKGVQDNPPPPAPPTLDEAKATALTAVNERCSLELEAVRAGYPADEVQSWAKQESEARAYVADAAAPTPLLSAMSAARGVDLALLAAKVIEKADFFAVASGTAIGTRQACEDAISAAQTVDDALAVTWPEPVPPVAEDAPE